MEERALQGHNTTMQSTQNKFILLGIDQGAQDMQRIQFTVILLINLSCLTVQDGNSQIGIADKKAAVRQFVKICYVVIWQAGIAGIIMCNHIKSRFYIVSCNALAIVSYPENMLRVNESGSAEQVVSKFIHISESSSRGIEMVYTTFILNKQNLAGIIGYLKDLGKMKLMLQFCLVQPTFQ